MYEASLCGQPPERGRQSVFEGSYRLHGQNEGGINILMVHTVTDYLDRSAELFPDKTACVDEKRSLTFSQLQSEAKKIAMKIIELGLFKQPVAVYLDKGVECISAFMGTAYSGNFYTVIDTKMPAARIEKIFATLKPKVILTTSNYAYGGGITLMQR